MARTAASFRRSAPSRRPQPTILVICEDTKSGKTYVEDAAIHFRVRVRVEIVHCGRTDPKGIVEESIRRKTNFDRVFCVVDRDTHPTWDEALRLADGCEGVEVVATYPCFEFWLILHFNANRRPYVAQGNRSPGECCVADLRQCAGMNNYNKGADAHIFGRLLERLGAARANSARVLADAKATGEYNPSSRMHELLSFFEGLA